MMLVNGIPAAQVSAQDRGLHYGDGVFETLAVREGRPLLWQRHMQRLHAGCARLGIPAPADTLLAAEAEQVCAGAVHAVLKIIVTRGEGARGYRTVPPVHATRLVALYPWPDWPEANAQHGVRARVCDTRLARNPALAGIKHLNRLEQVLARNEWQDAGIAEGLMLDTTDHVIEGTMSNLFVVMHNRLRTPEIDSCGIAGIMRGAIVELAARHSIACEITALSLQQLREADEIFLCNSLMAVWPVRELDGVHYAPGPLTQRVAAYVNEMMKSCQADF
ncbi:MAG: aminodeoxychorismate lyase [Gammaproteobacteria bacterium]|nr:aminodeoxychorismate lyase [Gammaproteobacteria bacterium]